MFEIDGVKWEAQLASREERRRNKISKEKRNQRNIHSKTNHSLFIRFLLDKKYKWKNFKNKIACRYIFLLFQ